MGRVSCWGSPYEYSALGGTPATSGAVVSVPNLTTAVEISKGDGTGSHTCARLANGTVWCWGDNGYGQLGITASGSPTATPVQATGITSAMSIATGGNVTCVVDGGTLKCFGYMWDSMARPWQLGTLTGVQSVARTDVAGGCVVMVGGQARCWGSNFSGSLGDGTTTTQLSPVVVQGLSNVATMGHGIDASCAVTTGGVGYCWGDNTGGRLGDGTTPQRLTPVEVLRP